MDTLPYIAFKWGMSQDLRDHIKCIGLQVITSRLRYSSGPLPLKSVMVQDIDGQDEKDTTDIPRND